MRVKVVSPIETAKGLIPVGATLEISEAAFLRLKGKVKQDLWCLAGSCWCSSKLAGQNHPAECLRISCEYYYPDTGTEPAQEKSP